MNDSVRRLAFQPVKAQKLVLQVPKPIPMLPESFLRRFPELNPYQESVKQANRENEELARANERVIRDFVTQATAVQT